MMTIGVLHAPTGDPRVQGFIDRVDANFAAAEGSSGFVGRSLFDAETEVHTWGDVSKPAHFTDELYVDRVAQTLSVWQDLETVFAFAYSGLHAESLIKGREWFVHSEWPVYVAWWIDDTAIPSWQEACERYEKLRRDGPSPAAFDFKHPFGPDGQPVAIDRRVAKRHAQQHTE
jgi:hypothetical protein